MRFFSFRVAAAALLLGASKPVPAAPTAEAEAYLDQAITLLETRHINSAQADWERLRAEAETAIEEARTPADTYPAIHRLLAELGERHSFLIEPQPTPAQPNGSTSRPPATPRLPTWRLIDGRFALLSLPALNTMGANGDATGRAYTQALQAGLQEMDKEDLCGWIIDLRDNSGGNMWPMLQGLDPLLGAAPFGYFVVAGNETTPWLRTPEGIFPFRGILPGGEPSFRLTHEAAPVAVLLGSLTGSSGEMTALALIGRSGVRTFGMPTAGLTTANSPHRLSDGAFLVITEATVRDRRGRDYSGAIVPDEQVPLEEAEAAAMRWLADRC